MASNQFAKKYFKFLNRDVRGRNYRQMGDQLSFQRLEDRKMMASIVWANRVDFDNEFGVKTAAAREVIDQVILDWSRVIENFNYRNVGKKGWSPSKSYTLTINVKDLGADPKELETLAECGPVGIDRDGKPFSGDMNIDNDASGTAWYFDPTPYNDSEFDNPIAPFSADHGPKGKFDLYSVVLHELGHGLGFASESKLAIHSHIRDHVFRFNDGYAALLTPDDVHTDDISHPNDLMNPSIAKRTRNTISELDARILGDGYGYTIDMGYVMQRSFVTTYDQENRELTIHGDLGNTLNPYRQPDQIYLNAMVGEIYVDVNGIRKTISTNSVDSIVVLGEESNDDIRVEATQAGMELTINAGTGYNNVYLSSGLHNLQHIQGDVLVFEDGGRTNISFQDENNTDSRTFRIDDTVVSFSESAAKIYYSGYLDPANDVYALILRGGSGGNRFSVSNSLASHTHTSIYAGKFIDVVNVLSSGSQGLFVDGVAGIDTVTLGSGRRHTVQDILGFVFVTNSTSFTDLILDDSGNVNSSRDIRLSATKVTGLAPAAIGFDPLGIQSLTILAGTEIGGEGNLITVLGTPQNRVSNLVVNLETGKNKDQVNVEATSSKLLIDGQDGRDQVIVGKSGRMDEIRGAVTVSNLASYTDLILDNSAVNVLRTASMTDGVFRLFSTRVFFNEQDLQSLTFLGGIRTNITVFDSPENSRRTVTTNLSLGAGIDLVNVQQTNGALTINGGGGLDTINIGYKGSVDQIIGTIDISNPPAGGYTTVNVDGSNEDLGHLVTLDSGSLRGLAPAEIRFQERDLLALAVSAGPFINKFIVVNTPQNVPRTLSVTLNTGLGSDTVNVERISSATTVNGQNGSDIVNVGLEGNMQGITNTLAITNDSSRSTINLDDSNDKLPRTVTMDVTNSLFGTIGSVTGLAPGQILYKQADLRALNVWGGSGQNTFTLNNTAANGIDPITTIYAGQGGDEIAVLGTSGRLVIDPQGSNNYISIGGPVGTTGGTLDRIFGDIVLTGGDSEPNGNRVEIRDAVSTGSYDYRMDSQRIFRTNLDGTSPTGSVYLNAFPLNRLTLVAAGNGNNIQIDGTPIHAGSNLVSPVEVIAGDGDDRVAIFGSTHPLNVALGNGIFQIIRIGDAKHSLDAIQGELSISGAGFVDAVVSDEESTAAHVARIDRIGKTQLVERRVYENGQYRSLNNIAFEFADQGVVIYQAGRIVTGDYNQIDVLGVVANTELIVLGGPDYDIFTAGFAGDTSNIQGPVTFNSPDADVDFGYLYDYASPVPVEYSFHTNPLNSSGIVSAGPASSPITYNGLTQLVYYSPLVGGNITNVQSLPASLFLNLAVSDGDAVTLGSAASGLGGTMANIAGVIQVASYGVNDAVTLTLDDSGNTTTARNVTIDDYQGESPWGVITGMTGSAALLFRDYENWNVDIRGGALDDSFVMRGSALAANVSIAGGAGNDILIGSGGNSLFGGEGRDLLVAGSRASVLDGGQDEDILIGGRLNNTSLENLATIRAMWSETGIESDYSTRVINLRAGLLADDKVSDNDELDSLTGGLDALDLFFGGLVTDLQESELLVPLF